MEEAAMVQRRKVRGAGGEPAKVPPPAPGTRDLALRRSAEQVAEQAAYRRAHRRMRAVQAFYAHLMAYIAVNLMLFFVDIFTGEGVWFFWPVLGWGAGIALHGAVTFRWLPFFAREWEETKIREIMEKERQG
jgi:hypothetical protein